VGLRPGGSRGAPAHDCLDHAHGGHDLTYVVHSHNAGTLHDAYGDGRYRACYAVIDWPVDCLADEVFVGHGGEYRVSDAAISLSRRVSSSDWYVSLFRSCAGSMIIRSAGTPLPIANEACLRR
jgi:hypothetical protein